MIDMQSIIKNYFISNISTIFPNTKNYKDVVVDIRDQEGDNYIINILVNLLDDNGSGTIIDDKLQIMRNDNDIIYKSNGHNYSKELYFSDIKLAKLQKEISNFILKKKFQIFVEVP